MPKGRTADYAIWRACERFGLIPPGVRRYWEDNDWWSQVCLIGYDQGRQVEEVECSAVPRL